MPGQPPRSGAKGLPHNLLLDERARDEAERQDRSRNEQLADGCARIEEEVEALRTRFELYFLGIERREPARERDELKRRVARLKSEFTRNTGLRFRIETLHARFLSYERMWTRNAREKEEGTYRRDLLRARRQRQKPAAPVATRDTDASGDGRAPTTAAAAEPVHHSEPAPPPMSVAGPGGLAPEQLRSLYDEYVDAKKRCHEDVSRLTYQALERTIARQMPQLVERYGARSVELKVVVKDGRAVLKAVPRS